jgi:hypothetical protein
MLMGRVQVQLIGINMSQIKRLTDEEIQARIDDQMKITRDHIASLEVNGYLDSDGYPTEELYDAIENWSSFMIPELFDMLEKCWWGVKAYGTMARYKKDGKNFISMSTVGWSGNEALIRALRNNSYYIWDEVFYQENRGGHFIFIIDSVACLECSSK